MAYSVMYDPQTGKAVVEINAEDLQRIQNAHTVFSLRDVLDKIMGKKGKK